VSDPKLPVGTNRCKCTACGRYFGGVGGFDLHQQDDGAGRTVCQDPATVVDQHGRRLLVEKKGYWVRDAPEAFAPGRLQAATGSVDSASEAVVVGGATLARQEVLL
jgi:hypothetical protein